MIDDNLSRRGLMQGAAALGIGALVPQELLAQQAPRTGGSLPARGELLIRGATVLTMDPAVPDLAVGDVHVRDGTILAVAPKIETRSAQAIDGSGMICIPGFVDTHFHLWNSMLRLYVRADVPSLGYFPVTARLGPLMGPEDSYRSVRLGASEALAPASPRCTTGRTTRAAPSTPTPNCRPCATWASADVSPTARPLACPTMRRWISPAWRVSKRTGCPIRKTC